MTKKKNCSTNLQIIVLALVSIVAAMVLGGSIVLWATGSHMCVGETPNGYKYYSKLVKPNGDYILQ